MDVNTSNVIQIGLTVVLTLTLIVIGLYWWETRNQAKASIQMAKSALRPVIVQWITEPLPRILERLPQGADSTEIALELHYRNLGNGPAVNMEWHLHPKDGDWVETPRRVGMGVHEGDTLIHVKACLSLPADGLSVRAEYEDVFGARWRSSLAFVEKDGILGNGESSFEELAGTKELG